VTLATDATDGVDGDDCTDDAGCAEGAGDDPARARVDPTADTATQAVAAVLRRRHVMT